MTTNETSEDGMLITFGEDAENQIMTSYIKLWRLSYVKEGFESLGNWLYKVAPMRKILIG